MEQFTKPLDLEELNRIGADPIFVSFILVWNRTIHAAKLDPVKTNRTETYKRRIKRRVQKDFGSGWKPSWKMIRDGWKVLDKMTLNKDLFSLQPTEPHPLGRIRKKELWMVVFDLRNYFFHRCNKKYNMGTIALILRSVLQKKLWTYSYLNSEWSKRKEWFKNEYGKERIETLLKYYEANKEKIAKALNTEVPLYLQATPAPISSNGRSRPKRQKNENREIAEKEDREIIKLDDIFLNVLAKTNVTVDGKRYKKGQPFLVRAKCFNPHTMERMGVMPPALFKEE